MPRWSLSVGLAVIFLIIITICQIKAWQEIDLAVYGARELAKSMRAESKPIGKETLHQYKNRFHTYIGDHLARKTLLKVLWFTFPETHPGRYLPLPASIVFDEELSGISTNSLEVLDNVANILEMYADELSKHSEFQTKK